MSRVLRAPRTSARAPRSIEALELLQELRTALVCLVSRCQSPVPELSETSVAAMTRLIARIEAAIAKEKHRR